MGLFKKDTRFKKCPFCKTKNYANVKKCNNCGLDFSQLDDCTNKEAKQMLKHRRFGETFEGEIVLTSKLPTDVSKKKLTLLTIFLGLFGAQNFYVGKYIKAGFQLVLGLFFAVCVVIVSTNVELGNGVANLWFAIGSLAGLFPILCWLVDLTGVIFNKFEVPIKLKTPVEIEEDEEV